MTATAPLQRSRDSRWLGDHSIYIEIPMSGALQFEEMSRSVLNIPYNYMSGINELEAGSGWRGAAKLAEAGLSLFIVDSAVKGIAQGFSSVIVPETEFNTPLGRGSTANGTDRWLPGNLREQLAVQEAMQNPGGGQRAAGALNDPRWPASEGWVKMQQTINPGGRGGPISVHYNFNTVTGASDDYKLVFRRPFVPTDRGSQ